MVIFVVMVNIIVSDNTLALHLPRMDDLAVHRKYFESNVALYYLRSYNYRLDRHFPPFPRSDFSAQSHSHTVALRAMF